MILITSISLQKTQRAAEMLYSWDRRKKLLSKIPWETTSHQASFLADCPCLDFHQTNSESTTHPHVANLQLTLLLLLLQLSFFLSDWPFLSWAGSTKQNLYGQVHTEWPAYSQPTQSAEGILCLQFTVHSATTTMLFSSCYITYFTTGLASVFHSYSCIFHTAFSALTLLSGYQEEQPASEKNLVIWCWRGYLSGTRCKWFAYGPADVTATKSSLAPLQSRLV